MFVFQLFDHIADCIGKFVRDHNLTGHTLPLGFTFSFPCKQEGLAKARLSKWTKGFRCEGVVGEDICALLQEALKRRTVRRGQNQETGRELKIGYMSWRKKDIYERIRLKNARKKM